MDGKKAEYDRANKEVSSSHNPGKCGALSEGDWEVGLEGGGRQGGGKRTRQ